MVSNSINKINYINSCEGRNNVQNGSRIQSTESVNLTMEIHAF